MFAVRDDIAMVCRPVGAGVSTLEQNVAIVTGAGRGIGAAIARRLARDGAVVVVAERELQSGNEVVDDIRAKGGNAVFIETDVRLAESVALLVHRVSDAYGGIDILCNNAGVGHLRTVIEEDDAGYDRIMDVNLRGIVHCCRHAIPGMVERGHGTVINIASVAGLVGFRRDAVYCASKGAVIALTRQMALDFGRAGVRVNAVCPGFTETPELQHYIDQHEDPEAARAEVANSHALGRTARPEEIASVVAFLASADASFVTGVSVPVDGGLIAQ
jgi:NAD(P)-dependent dehydrogenase (short-subunit alcohol dehydrogenase family)